MAGAGFAHRDGLNIRQLEELKAQNDEILKQQQIALDALDELQKEAEQLYRDRAVWASKAILNVARMGRFSSDRTIREYAKDIWGLKSVR